MTFQMQDGQIFINENDRKTDKHPSLKGKCMIDGVEYEFAAWPAKSGRAGSYSGKIKVRQAAPPPPQDNQMDDEIPF